MYWSNQTTQGVLFHELTILYRLYQLFGSDLQGDNPPMDCSPMGQNLENEVDAQHGNYDFYDLILGADITYDCSFPMISSLLDLISSLSHDETWTLLAHGVRSAEKAMDLWTALRQRWPQAQLLRSDSGISDSFEVMEVMEGGETETPVMIFALKGGGKVDEAMYKTMDSMDQKGSQGMKMMDLSPAPKVGGWSAD